MIAPSLKVIGQFDMTEHCVRSPLLETAQCLGRSTKSEVAAVSNMKRLFYHKNQGRYK